MSNTIVTVEALAKRYFIDHRRSGGDALRHRIEQALRHPLDGLTALRARRQSAREEFWALKNVSFDIAQGASVGIIGKNGAGKSTLLKILSRITEPTKGSIRMKGRVASLLEVGTGFHQELTGRENIFLNGAILGMKQTEIRRKFDEIVAFAEVEQFLDTPVKRYSSGMYVRLAFAVAAHLEPEILIVDEVLAVGDAAFQKKCLGQLEQAARGGRTVLFVSHNMAAVQALCSTAIYLQHGQVKASGPVEQLVNSYLSDTESSAGRNSAGHFALTDDLELLALEFNPNPATSGDRIGFNLKVRATKPTAVTDLSPLIYSIYGTRLAVMDFRSLGLPVNLAAGDVWQAEGQIKTVPFVEGDYSVGLYAKTTNSAADLLDLTTLTIRARTHQHGFAPYALTYRGVVELDFMAMHAGRLS
jgi:lipopolysaccharide transport system ATP-binding protein